MEESSLKSYALPKENPQNGLVVEVTCVGRHFSIFKRFTVGLFCFI